MFRSSLPGRTTASRSIASSASTPTTPRGCAGQRPAAARKKAPPMKLRVGIDVGGTFTDVTAFDEDQRELVAVRKYLSDPTQPAVVMENITADLARDFGPNSVSLVLHGSTAAL